MDYRGVRLARPSCSPPRRHGQRAATSADGAALWSVTGSQSGDPVAHAARDEGEYRGTGGKRVVDVRGGPDGMLDVVQHQHEMRVTQERSQLLA